ncbi:hypothetical protein ACFOSC_10675 [Streptantibioticus rubrisoli]|uniref:GH26 domain-containing protein n=1 Tax=Streptantibioticus rubrisoli TaxID=1387313 RepID=A0ABT1PD74_9ACTN|nr:hypothetical protein [Streptantibioticus rubrisoli]MCQ4042766.1 hypothetical protein [Streptantibioticus rubrisoli]
MTPLRRLAGRPWVLAATFVTLLTGCSGRSTPSTPDASASWSAPGGSSSVLFGGNKSLLHQPLVGPKLAIVRTYHELAHDDFPSAEDTQALNQGAALLTSFGKGEWTSIASGAQDSAIRSFLTKVDQAAVDHHLGAIYVTFNHEADLINGERPADFVKAWDHIHSLATDLKVNWQDGGRIHWALILTQGAYAPARASRYWPGAGNVDVVGVDGYNAADCRKHPFTDTYAATGKPEQPAQLFSQAVSFAARHGNLPVFIAEWGSVPYHTARTRADFIKAMASYITAHPSIRSEMYWDAHGQNNACDYNLANDPTATSALAAMAADSRFQAKP